MKYIMFLCTWLWYFFNYIPSIYMSTIFTYVSMKRQTILWVLHTCLVCIDFPLPQLHHHFPDYLCLNSSTQGISPSIFLSNVLHNPFHLSPLMHLFFLVGSFLHFRASTFTHSHTNMHVPKLKATNWILHLHRTLLSKVRYYIPPSLRPIVLFALKD